MNPNKVVYCSPETFFSRIHIFLLDLFYITNLLASESFIRRMFQDYLLQFTVRTKLFEQKVEVLRKRLQNQKKVVENQADIKIFVWQISFNLLHCFSSAFFPILTKLKQKLAKLINN